MTLYKYLDSSPLKINVIRYRKIRYSQIYALNDPFEGKPYYETLAPDDVIRSLLTSSFDSLPINPMEAFGNALVSSLRETLGDEHAAIVSDVESALQEVMPTPENPNNSRDAFTEFVDGDLIPLARNMGSEIRRRIVQTFNDEVGIFCLSKVRDNNLMWAHYAASSSGFVVGFDDGHAYFKSASTSDSMLNQLFDVEYSAERPAKENMVELAFRDILLTKPIDWLYESERRHVRPLSDGERVGATDSFGEPIVVFEFPAELLVEVIFGSRMTEVIKEELFVLLESDEYRHVNIFQARESENRYELVLDQIR